MAHTTTIYRNDSKDVYDIPGLGLIGPGQRVSHTGPFPPQVVLENYPGLVDVLDEEEQDKLHDYDKNPEPAFDEAAHRAKIAEQNEANDAATASAPAAPELPEQTQIEEDKHNG